MTATATSRNVNYLPWRCTTTTWNVLISRSMEYLNVRQRFLFLFLNFDRDLWNLIPKKEICQHLANWTRWNKGDARNKVWNAAWMQFLRACGGWGGGGRGVHDRWSDPFKPAVGFMIHQIRAKFTLTGALHHKSNNRKPRHWRMQ